MKRLNESGAPAAFPKFLKCLNCGCEVLAESYADMAANLPGFTWLDSPPHPPGMFQFGCPNNCGGIYVSGCVDCRQKFHYETSVSFGGNDDPTHVRFGERKMTESSPQRYRFIHKRQPRRRTEGESDGPLPQS